jgi:hypothetical protein
MSLKAQENKLPYNSTVCTLQYRSVCTMANVQSLNKATSYDTDNGAKPELRCQSQF